MFVILVYDVNAKRCGKVLKAARKYLTWIQNSVLEGEITEANLAKLKLELRHIIHEDEDSCIFYVHRTKTYYKREYLGLEKGSDSNFI